MSKNMVIFGITGTLGAGKGTIVDYLKEKGLRHFSVSGFLAEEVKRRGLPVNRDTLVAMGNELRAQHSPSYLAEQLYEQAVISGENCIIESLRTPGEVEALRLKSEFYLLSVDAKPEIRYQRIQARKSEKDAISFEKFLENEEREMESDDPNKQNLRECIARANFSFENNGTVKELRLDLARTLRVILDRAGF
ncbi:MAG: AAA family ATPase [Candidatus Paceibacterota bacterium]